MLSAGPTWRIRAYLAVMAFRYIGLGVTTIRSDEAFEASPHFRYVFRFTTPTVWAAIFVLVGVAAAGSAVWPRMLPIRAVLVVSVFLTVLWAAAFAAAELLDGTRAAMGTIFLIALAGKDLIVSSMPFGNPIEEMVRRNGDDR